MKYSSYGQRTPITFSSRNQLQNSQPQTKQEFLSYDPQARESIKDHQVQNSQVLAPSNVNANFKELLPSSEQKSSYLSSSRLTFPTQPLRDVSPKSKAPKTIKQSKISERIEKNTEKKSNLLQQNNKNSFNLQHASWIDQCLITSEGEVSETKQPCKICYYQNQNDLYKCELFTCGHSYHPECIEKHIQFKMESLQLPAQCPSDECSCFLSETDIKYHLSYSKYKLYQRLKEKVQIMTNPHLFFSCPTPGCSTVVRKSLIPQSFYECPECRKQFCVLCSQNWHYGPCMQDEEDYEFVMFSRKSLFKKCPKCKKIIEKSSGCHHISCICGYQFCYICQKNYNNDCQCRKIPFVQHQRMMQDQKNQERKKVQQEEKRRKQKGMKNRGEDGFKAPRKRQKKDRN